MNLMMYSFGINIRTGLLPSFAPRNDVSGEGGRKKQWWHLYEPRSSLRGAKLGSNPVQTTHFKEMQSFLTLKAGQFMDLHVLFPAFARMGSR